MAWYRIYVDKKITAKGGGDHSRVIDIDAKDEAAAVKDLNLKANEEVNQVVSLMEDPT